MYETSKNDERGLKIH